MRRAQKNQILLIINQLSSIHKQIKSAIDGRQDDTVVDLLVQAQQLSIQVGEYIEREEGEGTKSVSSLEEYCELLFEVSEKIEEVPSDQICSMLEKQKEKVLSEIKQIKEKKMVVFLPYKAAMWDSLENVWRKYNQDEEWEAIVIPIPYYNKRPNGTFKEVVYEGMEYPKDVPVVSWKRISLEEEHPDIIYIHNPYDEYNVVTSVHPDFYSSKIRQYTDKLVYIPYFVHQNDHVPKHYCVLPGTVYADEVILQSEKVKEQYIKYFSEYLVSSGQKVDKKKFNEKFLASGSPKYIMRQDENVEIPEEWKEFLGTGDKKVIFLNTHLRDIMAESSEQFFKKLKWVFDFFKENQEVVVLWRPHPLMLSTAEAMNPPAVKPYLELVDYYQKEKIGIYDDSSDLHRAINLSDAYYGDRSSVVELFKAQKKPVMIMDHVLLGDN